MTNSITYNLGVALSGGGVRGFAHAGALQAIMHAGLHPDAIAGVSAGAVIAVLYGAGVSPERMVDMFDNPSANFSGFTRMSLGSSGLFSAERFRNFIMRSIAPKTDFANLLTDVYVGVTDVVDGCSAEIHSGPIGDAMMASCSIPILFKPVNIDGHTYVDGGVLRNMPSWILEGRCRRLIGINVSPLPKLKPRKSLAGMAMRTYELMSHSSVALDMEKCDIRIEIPELASVSTFDMSDIRRLYNLGYEATREALIKNGLWPDAPADRPSDFS